MWMRDVVTLVKPRVFIAENVKGLANLADVKEVIERDFADACHGGYLVIPAHVLHAADYGVPQNRERIIFFGFKKSALNDEALAALTKDSIPPQYNPYPVCTHKYTSSAVGDLQCQELSTYRLCIQVSNCIFVESWNRLCH